MAEVAEVAEVTEGFLQERDLISVQCTVEYSGDCCPVGVKVLGMAWESWFASKHFFDKLLSEEHLAYIPGASLKDREQPDGAMFTFVERGVGVAHSKGLAPAFHTALQGLWQRNRATGS